MVGAVALLTWELGWRSGKVETKGRMEGEQWADDETQGKKR